jgi:hypothetical protein
MGWAKSRFVQGAVFFLALLAIMVGLLVGGDLTPAEAYKLYVVNIPLPGPTRLLLNVDSPEFMRMANEPATLLEPGNFRQSRPAYIIAGYLASKAIAPVAMIFQPFMPGDIGPTQRNVEKVRAGLKVLLPVYLGYLALNVALLLSAFLLYAAAIDRGPVFFRYTRILTWVGILLIANNVIKAFVWSPHTQMLNIMVPILGTFLVIQKRKRSRASLVIWGSCIGIGMLAYAAVAILFPCLILTQLRAVNWSVTRKFIIDVALSAIACALPTIIWVKTVQLMIGSYMLVETAKYDEIVWIARAWKKGLMELISAVGGKIFFFSFNAILQAIPAFLVLAISWAALKVSGADIREWHLRMRPIAWPAVAVSAICLLFFIFIGWPAPRLAYAAVPPLVVLAGAGALHAANLLRANQGQKLEWAIAIVVACWCVFTVLKAGPLA